jgi:hypothetical protein
LRFWGGEIGLKKVERIGRFGIVMDWGCGRAAMKMREANDVLGIPNRTKQTFSRAWYRDPR